MIVRRTNGAHPITGLRDELARTFDGLFEDVLGWSDAWLGTRTFPALNVWEDEGHLHVEAELPGLKMDDLEVLVVGNELTIKGETKAAQDESTSYHRRERRSGSFTRVIRLPTPVEAEKVEAALQNGILTVTLPKAEAAKPRKITVKTNA